MAATPPRRLHRTFRDDRGSPLQLAPESVLHSQLWRRTPFRAWLPRLIIIAIVVWLVVSALFGRTRPSPYQWVFAFAYAFLVGILPQLIARVWRIRSRPGQSALAAYLAAHRLCGACGYDLHAIAPESGGCVVCPECGAAWHQDRFVFEDQDPRDSRMLQTIAAAGHQIPTSKAHDDRGVPMKKPWNWFPHWMLDGTALTRELDAEASSRTRRFHTRALPIAAVVAPAAIAVFVLLAADPDFHIVTAICILTSLLVGAIYYVLVRLYVVNAMLRHVRLIGICPNCGHTLPADAPPTFDGCTVCPSCKLAWRPSGPQ